MAKATIEAMIPQALIEATQFQNEGKIESKLMGGIASFGASIISSGVRPTLLFYKAKGDKFAQFEEAVSKIIESYTGQSSIDVYKYNNMDHILDAVTALKLSMRTYEKVKNTGVDDE